MNKDTALGIDWRLPNLLFIAAAGTAAGIALSATGTRTLAIWILTGLAIAIIGAVTFRSRTTLSWIGHRLAYHHRRPETADLAVLGTAQIRALGTSAVAGLTSTQIESLSPTQVAAMSTAQLARLETITSAQLAALSSDKLNALTSDQFPTLSTDQIAALGMKKKSERKRPTRNNKPNA